jgi:hypothetical protein
MVTLPIFLSYANCEEWKEIVSGDSPTAKNTASAINRYMIKIPLYNVALHRKRHHL